ncbi:hypothetical protein C5V32_02460 [Salmonella enterica subsp. enterica serovar Oranienburg]|uniref:Uncharacterized protein n=1 Tax=Salmonella enterica subsp. enterica serovar Sandiego TaxID=1151002 RepID=A0A8E7KJC7_SALET|nr:hypothetical protein [Salmonella enterica]ECU0252230.1 hypothetical protein [Salmonella enterica subsp. enterica serovar Oranienburg]EDU6969545.1 hypothetical protein [Salmonella enterica subsp. enterica serovar Sandiego]EBH0655616.1 hypothetical protein [Salmonella enterica]EBN6187051.1 hypothetical protein [Salmonella enterica]
MMLNVIWWAVAYIKKSLATLSIFRRLRTCFPALEVLHNLAGCPRFVGLPLLIFTLVFIPPIFIGIHYPILILMNVVLLTERSDRDVWRHRSENDLSVIGIIRPAVVSPTPFFYVLSVLYFSGAICSVDTSKSLLTTGGEI